MSKPKDTPNTGAPAVLKRLEGDAAKFSDQIDDLDARIAALRDVPGNENDNQQINGLLGELSQARKNFTDTAKVLLSYDKGIAPARKDGEKIPVSEVESIITQLFRFDRIAFETHLLSISQDAIRCKDEQEYYAKFADSHRACRETAILAGVEHEKFPPFVRAAYERSL